jgi:hypothetical protein
MTASYVDSNFDKIKAHASVIEARVDDSDLNAKNLKTDNQKNIEGFQKSGEKVILINVDYESDLQRAFDYLLIK